MHTKKLKAKTKDAQTGEVTVIKALPGKTASQISLYTW